MWKNSNTFLIKMTDILDKISSAGSNSWEQGLANLGMGTPAKRFIVGTAAGAAIIWAVRPPSSFDQNGQAKSWVVISDPSQDSTAIPWWALAMVPGIIFSTFF